MPSAYEELDRRKFIETLADNAMSFCGKCKSLYPQSSWHWCNEKESHTGSVTDREPS